MKKILILYLVTSSVMAQTGSEIYLLDISTRDGMMQLSNPVNVTDHPGYDNQPFFHEDQPILYYSSFNEEGRSDIKSYNYKTGETKLFTHTQEREYSPTLTPDKQFISCIIQRDNNAQDLGKYPVAGGEAVTLIDNLIVGYHAWMDESRLILFVLGDPLTLRLYDLNTKKEQVIAEHIGRSLHKIPGQQAMSFVHKKSDDEWVISRLDSKTLDTTPITTTLKSREDLTWTGDGKIVMSDGAKLFVYDLRKKGDWTEVTWTAKEFIPKGVTRLAISNDGKKLAMVVSE
jgi:hypothetical protein